MISARRTTRSVTETMLVPACGLLVLMLCPGAAPSASRQALSRPETQDATAPAAPPPVLVTGDQDYRIGPRDVIELRVNNAPELSVTVSVAADGSFLMPYLGRMKAAGKTPEALGEEIAGGLRGRYLKNPSVSVAVKQYNSRSYFVLGAVKRPGVYQIDGRPSLVKLLTVAGGPADNHGSTAVILREVKRTPDAEGSTSSPADDADGPDYTVRTVNINGIFKGVGVSDQEAYLEPGDIVNVPPADVFFVAGEVNAPGQFPLSDGTTLRQAMALAQGTTFNAAASHGIVFRSDPATGKREEIPVDISAVMKNKGPDMPLIANDIVLVPNSKGKTIGNAVLKAFGIGMAQRAPYRY